jgi:SOS-response transcriptional repressor LexA
MKTEIAGRYNAAAERGSNVIGAKIAEARRNRGWNLGMLTEALKGCGVELTRAAVNKWETGETVPNAYQFLAVCTALGMDEHLAHYRADCPQELNAEGLRRLDEYRRDLVSSGNYRPKAVPAQRLVEMPVALMPAAAGCGNLLDSDDYYETLSFPEDSVNPRADVGIRVSGDSMEPVFHDGDVVWVQKCSELNVGEVGVFLYDNQAYIKQYGEREPGGEERELFTDSYGGVRMQPVLHSYNAAKYGPIVISPYAPFRVFGRVLRA